MPTLTVDQALQYAAERHQAGLSAEAEAIYRQIIAHQPNHPEAYYRLGEIRYRAHDFPAAKGLAEQAVALRPQAAPYHQLLGLIWSGLKQYEAAAVSFRQALRLDPRLTQAHRQLPAMLAHLGRTPEVVDALRAATRFVPDDPVMWNNLAVMLTDFAPESATDARYDEAIACCQRAIALKPDFFEAHNNHGNALSKRKRWEEAISIYDRALALSQAYPQTHINLGTAYFELGRYDESIACWQRALTLAPASVEAHQNLGSAYLKKWELDQAIAYLQRAVALKPDCVDAYSHLGVSYCGKGDLEGALHFHRQAVAAGPSAKNAHWNLAVFLLLTGRYEEGWREYEWRLGYITPLPNFSKPRWDGRAMEGQTLLLYVEQGHGDTLQFLRYATLVRERARAGRLLILSSRKLARLLRRNAGPLTEIIVNEHVDEATLPNFDRQLPLMSSPLALGNFEPLPISKPYLSADPALQQVWRDRLASARGLRVGLIWAGNPEHKEDRRRSIDPNRLRPLLGVEGVTFYSLQIERASEILRPADLGLVDHTEWIHDFEDTAAFMTELDLIISVDTAAAHLAGALGRPVWALLAFIPDWRWGLQGETTPWYPTMRLFRQSTEGDWESVVRHVAAALAVRAALPH